MNVELVIPTHSDPVVKALATMPDAAFTSLLDALKAVQPSANPQELKMAVGSLELGAQPGHVVSVLVSLRTLADQRMTPMADIALAVCRSAEVKGIVKEGEETRALKDRVAALLGVPALAITAKAYELATEGPAPLLWARVVSDVRPLFVDDSDHELKSEGGSIILHTLVLHCMSDIDYYVAMTPEDLRQLRKTVDRAIQKEGRLRAALDGTPLVAIGTLKES